MNHGREGVGVVRNPRLLRLISVAVLSAVAACSVQDDPAIPTLASEPQPTRESPSEAPARSDGSLAALTSEVRQLRLAVEELARSQSETQALTVYLSAQQSRMQQADQQLAAVRDQIASTTAVRQDLETRLARLLADQPRARPIGVRSSKTRSTTSGPSKRASISSFRKPAAAKTTCHGSCSPKKRASTS